jgi:DNA/RNA-binding domain of Phe-tRNA-synthetase-like protein
MQFFHRPAIWSAHPELVAGTVVVQGIRDDLPLTAPTAAFTARGLARLAQASEGDWPEIQAWRRTFSRMGLKPTQYRCASESLLRRLRKDQVLPALHPLVDLCNAASVAYGIPIAVFDTGRIAGGSLQVAPADGSETYLSFSGEREAPEPGEVVFVDGSGHAHARRWTHRQSALSAVRPQTASVLIVAEALHASARDDVPALLAELTAALRTVGCRSSGVHGLSAASPRFDFGENAPA